MSQLKDITFQKIGSLELDDDGILSVGPILPSWENLNRQPDRDYSSWVLQGPFTSVHAFLSTTISHQTSCAPSRGFQTQLTLLRMLALSLPDPSLDGPPFVLSMPDFNYQNIFVADDGRVSCLIDWDGIDAVPIQGGYARYPSWITRDWDPSMYGYPEPSPYLSESAVDQPPMPPREEIFEDSPTILQQFRDEYLAAYASVDPAGARITRNSHIYEAISIAASNWICTGGILSKLAGYAFGLPSDDHQFLTAYELQGALENAAWTADYIEDAERFTPPSAESKEHWEMRVNSITVARSPAHSS
ncbi:hypothetical protein M413DRAFT_29944 [Hebeloma cylindrosporum]|uniref:Aminoglycoside phosphotransferase domain-containing protein n=1 Tax=Hebeloma cylindrosporum TaxID=76867 RepID=A0A0C2XLV2_HEBCY|nr:hypothetical protein M413DRAFT_29944 [Hebeloma cylindrosporum h7]